MNYCTIFDSLYLSRGLVCYESLIRVEPEAHVFFFCLDQLSAEVIEGEGLANCTVLRPTEFQCAELLSVKADRSPGEYAWTVKPYAISYVFSQFDVGECTYIDADLYFLGSPQVISDRISDFSVLLTPHNFAPSYDTSVTNGVYSAQYITFRNDISGKKLLLWWKERCLEWCFATHEPGRFGDQKYLEFMAAQAKVVISNHLGLLGPWNIERFAFSVYNNMMLVSEERHSDADPAIFYHFHGFKLINCVVYDVGGYPVRSRLICKLYATYAEELRSTNLRLATTYGIVLNDNRPSQRQFFDIFRAARNWATRRYRLRRVSFYFGGQP